MPFDTPYATNSPLTKIAFSLLRPILVVSVFVKPLLRLIISSTYIKASTIIMIVMVEKNKITGIQNHGL